MPSTPLLSTLPAHTLGDQDAAAPWLTQYDVGCNYIVCNGTVSVLVQYMNVNFADDADLQAAKFHSVVHYTPCEDVNDVGS